MRFRLTPVFTGLCLLGVVNAPVFGSTVDQEEIIRKLNERTLALESELKELKLQVKQLKTANATKPLIKQQTVIVKRTVVDNQTTGTSVEKAVGKVGDAGKVAAQQAKEAQMPQNVVFEEPASIASAVDQAQPLYLLNKKPLYLGGTPVVVSPYLGLRSETDIDDLIISLPYVNEDLRILRQRQEIAGLYEKFGYPAPTDPVVDFSGKVEAQVIGSRPYTGNRTSDVDLSAAELDVLAMASSWATGFMAIMYDNAPPASGRRIDNSRLFIDKAFVTIGNLAKQPIYATLGQFYVPFGQYGSYMISDPLTKLVGRIKARSVLLGFNKVFSENNTINGSVFAYRGDTVVNGTSNINEVGANFDYTFSYDKWNGDAAISYSSNIADSGGMQKNGGTAGGFTGFANTSQLLNHKVPGVDVRGSVGYGAYSLIAEYVTAAKAFSAANMTFNNSGARPQAFHLEGVYNFKMWGKKSLMAIGYDQTSDALALLLPKRRYIAILSTAIWDWTIASLEFRHDINYGTNNVATGQGLAVVPTGLGNTSDTLTFQLGVYF